MVLHNCIRIVSIGILKNYRYLSQKILTSHLMCTAKWISEIETTQFTCPVDEIDTGSDKRVVAKAAIMGSATTHPSDNHSFQEYSKPHWFALHNLNGLWWSYGHPSFSKTLCLDKGDNIAYHLTSQNMVVTKTTIQAKRRGSKISCHSACVIQNIGLCRIFEETSVKGNDNAGRAGCIDLTDDKRESRNSGESINCTRSRMQATRARFPHTCQPILRDFDVEPILLPARDDPETPLEVNWNILP